MDFFINCYKKTNLSCFCITLIYLFLDGTEVKQGKREHLAMHAETRLFSHFTII